MDVSEYDCGIRQEENSKMKLGDSYTIAVESGYDSIYSGCSSVLMEKSFSRESFDIFSPNSTNGTPNKKTSALKYHISTPKTNASVKRHLYSSFNHSSSLSKRIKSENNENEPQAINSSEVNNSVRLNVINNHDFPSHKYLLTSTAVQGFLKSPKDEVFNSKHSAQKTYKETCNEKVLVPQRPSKNQRYFTPKVIHSKRKLEILPKQKKTVRTYCNGRKFLNIISRLDPFPLILQDIFNNLTSKDLLNMSLVSKNWSNIVKSNTKVNTRIQQYLNESRNVKENHKESTKLPISTIERNPFGQFNLSSISNIVTKTTQVDRNFYENQSVVQQLSENERLVKCPRCCKGSIVSDSSERLHLTSFTRVPTAKYDSQSATSVLHDTESNSISAITKDTVEPHKSEHFGLCTSLLCNYIFCPKCLCDYHPGENCKISEPISPSKILTSRKKSKLKDKPSCKSNSKRHALKRLCFS